MAYRLAPPQQPDALAKLDHRERGGYVRESVNLEFGEASSGVVRAVMYRATPRNPNYLGPAPLERIAQQVRASHGPSGSNSEYVLRLAEALRVLGAEDEHVFALEALLRASGDGGDVARGSSARA
jgi:cation transport regulator ChaC